MVHTSSFKLLRIRVVLSTICRQESAAALGLSDWFASFSSNVSCFTFAIIRGKSVPPVYACFEVGGSIACQGMDAPTANPDPFYCCLDVASTMRRGRKNDQDM